MDQIHLMKVFVAAGELENFAAASRRLDMSPAAVTRAISALEESLGVHLFHRNTRSVGLSEVGRSYLDDCRSILASIEQANQAAATASTQPKGNLSVTAPPLFGKVFVMPTIVNFLKSYPDVNISAFFVDRVINLVEEGMDIAVRIGPLPDSRLKALRVGSVRKLICGSPDYLERHGLPRHPDDLKQHDVIAASSVYPWVDWRFTASDEFSLRLKPRLSVTSNDLSIEAAAAGIGLARFHSYQVVEEIASGRLVTVLEEFEEEPWPIHIVHRETRQSSAKVRSFVEALAADLRRRDYTGGDRPPA